MRLLVHALAFTLVLGSWPTSASAQSTGGRVGGFGGSSSGSSYRPSSSSRSFGSSSSSSSSSSSYTPPRIPSPEEQRAAAERTARWRATHELRGAPAVTAEEAAAFRREPHWTTSAFEDGAAVAAGTFFAALVLYFFLWLAFAKRYEVRRLSVGFGPRARVELQAALRELARTARTATPQQRGALLAEVVSRLRAHRDDVRYVAWQSIPVRHYRGATATVGARRFFALAADLRARYRHETTAQSAPDLSYRAEEGPGLLVVSVVTLASRGRDPFGTNPHELDRALFAMERQQPEGLELIWSPSESADRLSSAELESLYPELQRLDERVGRVTCKTCSAVFAAELRRCPACGRPR